MKTRQNLLLFVILFGLVVVISLILASVFNPQDNPDVGTPRSVSTLTKTPAEIAQTLESILPSATATALTTPVVRENCTRTLYYWDNLPERYPAQIVIGNEIYNQQRIKVLLGTPDDSVKVDLEQQLIVAVLNHLAGADIFEIETELLAAYNWLDANSAVILVSGVDLEMIQSLLAALRAYNEGLIGPGACGDDLRPPTATVTHTPGITLTPTGTPTITPQVTFMGTEVATPLTPTMTATVTVTPRPTRTPFIPTWTLTREPPSHPTRTWTPSPTPVTPSSTPVTPSSTPVTPSSTPVTPSPTPVTPSSTPVTPSSTPTLPPPTSTITPPP